MVCGVSGLLAGRECGVFGGGGVGGVAPTTGLLGGGVVAGLECGAARGWLLLVLDPDREERIQVPQVELTTYYLGENREADGERRETVTGVFRPWPLGDTGLYSARVNFDEAGQWRAEVAVTPPGEHGRTVRGYFGVSQRSFTPAIGSDAPRSVTKTVGDVPSLGTDHVVTES